MIRRSKKQPASRRQQGGFTIIEMIVTLLVAAVLTVGAIRGYVEYAESILQNATTGHASRLMDGALNYIADNRASIIASAGPTSPVTITHATLLAGGYIDANVPVLNPYGQTPVIVVCEPTAGVLDGMLYYRNGQVIAGKSLLAIANSLGIAGGYVNDATGVAQGAFGSWTKTMSACGGSATVPGAGHPVLALFLKETADQAASGSYVHRTSVAGRPELNRMGVNLDMGGNELRNAARVYSTGRISAGEYIELQAFATAGAACSPNGLLARNSAGNLLSCVSGVWRLAGT